MSKNVFIDVTAIQPLLKHQVIFQSFDALEENDAITLKNDHDPKPLYYELLGERGDCFSWNYIIQGPVTWELEIRKKSLAKNQETIGEMARRNFRYAEAFKKLGIDYCCGGKKTVEEVCQAKGLNTDLVKAELRNAELPGPGSPAQHNFDAWPLSFLADYIVNIHHTYVRESTALLDELSEKVARKHSDKFAELPEIRTCVVELLQELNTHMMKEEKILFPFIKQAEQNGGIAEDYCAAFDSVQKPISVIEHDHDVAGDLLRKLRSLTNDYTVPPNACNSFNFLFKKLEEFESDLHQHIHLENNILFPKAIVLEKAG